MGKYKSRYNSRYLDKNYHPKLRERYVQDEGSDNINLNYIFLDDVPEEYVEEFSEYVIQRNKDLCVETKIATHKGEQTEYSEKIAVNVHIWEKWYSKKINKR